ncbi:unnamed protein product [Cuscuta europaea]|uniref:Uncharacterized protein n=1 Tax=Cuscuta europaea TaxID=41803 RepID=A0A9P0ZYR4_CUSEU|nr:unnamed protein product [Cuscuta europaea]
MLPPLYSSQPRRSSQVNSKGLNGSATPHVMGSDPGMQMQPPNTHPSVPRFPFQAPQNPSNNGCVPQIPGQFFAPNNFAVPTHMNANAMMPNNQWSSPNNSLIQIVNQLLQVQMQLQNPNFSQIGPSSLPFYANSQAPHNGDLQDPNFGMNAQLLLGNFGMNLLEQPQQGNIPSTAHPHLNQSSSNPSDAATSQGGQGHATRINSKGPRKSSFNYNFNTSQGGNEATHSEFGKPTTQSSQNAKKNFSIHNNCQVKEALMDRSSPFMDMMKAPAKAKEDAAKAVEPKKSAVEKVQKNASDAEKRSKRPPLDLFSASKAKRPKGAESQKTLQEVRPGCEEGLYPQGC